MGKSAPLGAREPHGGGKWEGGDSDPAGARLCSWGPRRDHSSITQGDLPPTRPRQNPHGRRDHGLRGDQREDGWVWRLP